jgi:hypothetical protein
VKVAATNRATARTMKIDLSFPGAARYNALVVRDDVEKRAAVMTATADWD